MNRFLKALILPATLLAALPVIAAPASVQVGRAAPAFTYRLLDHKVLSAAQLHNRKYILWVVGTWCPSCQAGSQLIAQHIAELKEQHAALVELEAFDNLGAKGPDLASFRRSLGPVASAQSWYFGTLTREQTAFIDPQSATDIFYLVDEHGIVRAAGSAPAAHWDVVQSFLKGR